ncbi:MAG: hypothetical protein M3M97_05800 [Actinomycetota bacterium]|nr:hypothetical protein [Actinomycetota bacterium]
MTTPTTSFYPNDGPLRIPFSEKMREAVQDQLRDNKQAVYARVQAIAFQVSGQSVDRRDLLTLLYEMPLPTPTITDNFAISPQELVAIRNAEPISIVSCLECRAHLPDGNRQTFVYQLRTLRYLGRFQVGELVDLNKLCEVLCDDCSQGMRHCLQEQGRAELLARQARKAQLCKMRPEEYRKTREYRSRRNQALIRAGNRCQVCGTHSAGDNPLDAHHNNYDRFGDELLVDLVVLCRRCHYHYHEKLPKAA